MDSVGETRSMRRFGRAAVLALALLALVAAAACGDDVSGGASGGGVAADGGSTGDTIDTIDTIDTTGAADAAQAAIDEGDGLDTCPMGTPAEMVEAIPDTVEPAPALGESIDNGQVFSGGEVDITYCDLFASDGSPGQIGEIRIDVAPGAEVDVDTYLEEEFVDPEDVETERLDSFGGGEVTRGCWGGGEQTCAVFWQGEDLFVSIVPMADDADTDPGVALTVAEALVPLAVANLAG